MSVGPRFRHSALEEWTFTYLPWLQDKDNLVISLFIGLWLSAEGILKGKRRTSRIVFDFKAKHWLSPAFASFLQTWHNPPPVWIIKKWWNKPQVMLYRDILPRVGKVRSEILIINLYRSQQWRALLRVEKVKEESIGKKPHTHKNSGKGWALWEMSGLFLFHMGKLDLQCLYW